jgi:hypothetical protein
VLEVVVDDILEDTVIVVVDTIDTMQAVSILALTLVHVEGVISGLFVRSILVGAIIAFVGALVVVIIVPLTDHTR